jgi:hypothetical protein
MELVREGRAFVRARATTARRDIASMQAWVSGLILVVLCEVGTRIGTILVRTAEVSELGLGLGGRAGVGLEAESC